MPNHYSSLKDVYKRTYEELKNPKSPIGIFLASVDKNSALEHAKEIKKAVKEYIKLFEQEEKNFIEPAEGETKISYVEETNRLQANREVEKKLAAAVVKMNDALDIFAASHLKPRTEPTPEEIAEMENFNEKIAAQRERVLNATYNIEVELEEKMIEKLKSEYKAFDHRPVESKVELSPNIKNSAHYRIRHIELMGNKEVPTAFYGLMRFRDLLLDHETMVNEAERSRQYTKFVNDRLAGFQAWKNTLQKETEVYNEIKEAVDESYFNEYNRFMERYPGTSSAEGYQKWFNSTKTNVEKWRNNLTRLEDEQKLFDDAVTDAENDLKELRESLEIERVSLNEAIKQAETDAVEAEKLALENNNTREQSEKLINDLKEELKNVEKDMKDLDIEQEAAKETLIKNTQQVQKCNNELEKLQQDIEKEGQSAIKTFLKNHADALSALDENLRENLDEFGRLVKEMDNHNLNIKRTEEAIQDEKNEMAKLRDQRDGIVRNYEEAQQKAEKDLDEQRSLGKKLGRAFTFGKAYERRKAELEDAKQGVENIEAFEETINKIKEETEKHQNTLNEHENALESYKNGWYNTNKLLNLRVKNLYEYTKELQVRLNSLEKEKETELANLDYQQKVDEIKKESAEKQESYKSILDKTASEFDRLKNEKAAKENRKKELQGLISGAEGKITECDKVSEQIAEAKGKKEVALKNKEEYINNLKSRIAEKEFNLKDAKDRADFHRPELEEARKKHASKIASHDKMKAFFEAGKVTSNRVLKDLQEALPESMKIAAKESKRQHAYITRKENNLMIEFVKRMSMDNHIYADRVRPEPVDKNKPQPEKPAEIDGSIKNYLQQLSKMKGSNSKEFNRMEKSITVLWDEHRNFLFDNEVELAIDGKNRERTIKDLKDAIKEIADSTKAYVDAKGSASRFTESGKERYRFADEMRVRAEKMLKQFEIFEKERAMADKLMNMDDSNLVVSTNLSFYKTDSYNMTKGAFVKKGEFDKTNDFYLPKNEEPEVKNNEVQENELEEPEHEL